MRKLTICVKKIAENQFEVWCPSYGQFLITSTSEEEGMMKLKKEIKDYLAQWPNQLKEFNEVSKSIRLKRL